MKSNTLPAILAFALILTLMIVRQPDRGQSPTPPATVEVATEMAPAPTDCGPVPDGMQIDPMITGAIGTWPIWVEPPSRAGRAVIAYSRSRYSNDSKLTNWWSTKVGWFIKKTYRGEVRLSGFNVSDHSPIYFDIGSNQSKILTPSINPEHPGGGIEGLNDYAFFPSLLWVSKAGCYTLVAEWDGGMWNQTVPVGWIEGW